MDSVLTPELQEMLAQCEVDFANRYTESDPDYSKALVSSQPPIVYPWYSHARRNYDWSRGGNHGGKDRWRDRDRHHRRDRDDRRHNRYQPYRQHR